MSGGYVGTVFTGVKFSISSNPTEPGYNTQRSRSNPTRLGRNIQKSRIKPMVGGA